MVNVLDFSELRAEMGRNNLSIPKLAKLIGMDKKTLYARFNGVVAFKQPEIYSISKVLNLSDTQIFNIFFANEVS